MSIKKIYSDDEFWPKGRWHTDAAKAVTSAVGDKGVK
jgi:hypothetical protein